MNAISVMIVDERLDRRAAMRRAIIEAGMGVVAESGYGRDAPGCAAEHGPDVLLVAVDEPAERPMRAIQNLRAANPLRPVVVYSTATDLAVFRQAMRAGVADYLMYPLAANELRDALAGAVRGARQAVDLGEPEREGTIITVFGPKGGIGKSSISANLAAAIAASTAGAVLLIDFDLFFGDTATLTGVRPTTTAAELAAGLDGLDRASFFDALQMHEESGISVLASAGHPSRWLDADPDQLRMLLTFAARYFDYVVVDTPGALSETVAAAVEMADHAFAVTNLDAASVRGTAYVFSHTEEIGAAPEKLHLVINHASRIEGSTRAELERLVGAPTFWEIPYDPAIARATQTGRLVMATAPTSRAALSIAALAGRVTQPSAELPAAERPASRVGEHARAPEPQRAIA